jgi:LysR family cys regulon transcriptional activator
MLLDGRADIGIATEALADNPDIAAFPYHSWNHAVVVPKGHDLQKVKPLTLEAISEWPIITYHEGFTGRPAIDAAFAKASLAPDIVMAALDADVIKSYVELGLGVGIIASIAFDKPRDSGLVLLDSKHLFPLSTSRIALRRGRYLRGYAYRFIEFCAPDMTEANIRKTAAVET